MSLEQSAGALTRHGNILITSHFNPDGDCIGSQLGLAALLARLGHKVMVVDQDEVPQRYRFLPGWERIRHLGGRQKYEWMDEVIGSVDGCTAVAVLDCADMDRIGRVAELVRPAGMEIINIDHHISNTGFGQVSYVDPAASSTCELVCRLAKRLSQGLRPEEAACLLAGIITDTGGFRYSSTAPATMRMAAELMEQGAEMASIATKLYFEERPEALRLLGELLVGMKQSSRAPLAWMTVSQDQLRRHGLEMPETEEFVRYALSVKGVEVGLMFKEQGDGRIRLSFRSKGKYDVNLLAKMFGGGGHVQAAGARVEGSLPQVEAQVIEALEKEMRS